MVVHAFLFGANRGERRLDLLLTSDGFWTPERVLDAGTSAVISLCAAATTAAVQKIKVPPKNKTSPGACAGA